MSISFVGGAVGAVGTTSANLPSFQSGDVALVFAFRDGSTTNPTVPAGWNTITNTADGTTCSASVGWRRLIYTDTTTGSWTNATKVCVAIYRGCEVFITPVGGGANGTSITTTVPYTTFTMSVANGSSWVVGMVGHRSTDTNIESAAITGMTNRASASGSDTNCEIAFWDTNGGVSSWSTTNQTITGTTSGSETRTVELLALPSQVEPIVQVPRAPMLLAA